MAVTSAFSVRIERNGATILRFLLPTSSAAAGGGLASLWALDAGDVIGIKVQGAQGAGQTATLTSTTRWTMARIGPKWWTG